MPTITRRFKEGTWPQGQDEKIAYSVDTTPWGGTPAGLVVKVFDVTNQGQYADVSGTCLSGSASASGNDIITPLVQALTPDHTYRLEVQWTNGGNTFEAYGIIKAEL